MSSSSPLERSAFCGGQRCAAPKWLVRRRNLKAFRSPYQGLHSLRPGANGRETVDVTLYAGFHPWPGAEIWINPEVDQGFGLSDTFGVAGYPSGEAYKLGKSEPYFLVQR